MTVLAVIAAGGLGAGLRFIMGATIQRRLATELPWPTAIVNTLGSLALGVILGTGSHGAAVDVTTGLIAGFTTFSTWMIEAVYLWEEGRGGRHRAVIALLGPTTVGLLAAAVGFGFGSLLAR
ncbi:MAG: CrcB family protein [Acidimicrobiia bacterium]